MERVQPDGVRRWRILAAPSGSPAGPAGIVRLVSSGGVGSYHIVLQDICAGSESAAEGRVAEATSHAGAAERRCWTMAGPALINEVRGFGCADAPWSISP